MTHKELMHRIDDEGVEFIRLQFTDVWGKLKNIAVTPGQMDRVVNKMYSIEGSALFDDLFEYEDELYLLPDLDTFVILPWRPQQGKVAKLICDVCYADGSLCELSPRSILSKMVKECREEGLEFKVNPECEFFLFHTDENGNPTTLSHERAGYLDVGPADFGENARRDMVFTLEDMGFEIESSHHEKAPAQHEIDFAGASEMETADSIMTFKFAVRSIAKRFGLYATFMPKPRTDVAGSGMHLNLSLYNNGQNIFDAKNSDDTWKYFIGGIMEHTAALCAITNPIVNSYKRLLSGFNAPGQINWSTKGESSLIKYHNIFGEARIELRFPDSAANPYLALAVCIAAGMDGIKNKILPPAENEVLADKLPGNINEAVKALLDDQVICNALGSDFVKIYSDVKTKTWNEYMKQVTSWEVDQYLIKM